MDKILEEASESIGNAAERDVDDEIDGFYDCVSEIPEGKEHESAADARVEAEAPEQYKDLDEALQFKEEGNRLFVEKQYDLAITQYEMALELCPDTDDCKDHKAAFLHNRGACYYYQEDYTGTVEDMTAALELKPDYVKALRRRAQAFEKLDKLEEALKDVNRLLELEPQDQYALRRKHPLEEQCRERAEKMKEEAMAKLKELGNSLLGAFGFSLDNFQMQQDPNTGSYSISFQK